MNAHDDVFAIECRIEMQDDTARVRPIGELDLAAVPFVEECLQGVREAAVADIVLDLGETTFIDSTAMHLAVAWQERARRERFTFAVTRGPAAVRRAMDLAGLGSTMKFVE